MTGNRHTYSAPQLPQLLHAVVKLTLLPALVLLPCQITKNSSSACIVMFATYFVTITYTAIMSLACLLRALVFCGKHCRWITWLARLAVVVPY